MIMIENVSRTRSTDRQSDEYLEVNACGIEHISRVDRGSRRTEGRKDYHILYVERGVCHVMLDDVWQTVEEGGIILFRPHEPQIYRYFCADDPISHFFHFTGVGCEGILDRLGIGEMRVFMMGRSASFEEISKKMTQEMSMHRPLYGGWCAAYMYQLLNIIARKYALSCGGVNPRSEKRINAACLRICENLTSPPTVEILAAECCLSVSRFVHLFREVTGGSVTDFTATARMQRAKELLLSTDLSVREVGEAVGYDDQNYFSRCFRKSEGCSPRRYRQDLSQKT
jgi:AraC-like DNA-binding protein